jgi:phosphatidylglycerophosphate synthase
MIAFRWQLPESPLRASVAAAQAGGLVLVALSAWAIRASLNLSAVYPVAAGAAFVAVMSVAAGFLNDTHPFASFGAGNQITTLRLLLVALVAGLVGEPASTSAATVAVVAAAAATVLDGMDGRLARRRGMTSAFGARFDMEVDALLIMALAALAYRDGKAGAWVLASGLLRYLFVAAGWTFSWLRTPLPPSRRRQTVCVVQVVALIAAVSPAVSPPFSSVIAGSALALLCYSFLVDTLWLKRRAC